MTIRKILVPLSGQHDPEDPEALDGPALELGFVAGRALNVHVEVFCIEARAVRPHERIAPWLPGTAVDQLIDVIDEESARRCTQARAAFDAAVARHAPPRAASPQAASGFCANFVERVGDVGGSLAVRGRLADLIVTAKPPVDHEQVPMMLESALRETGRPVLIAPAAGAGQLGRRVALAWNGSAEASRAVALAHPFLERAEEVLVISVCEDGPVVPSAEELADYLTWHGLAAKTVTVEGTAGTAGDLLLEQAAKAGADLLVMGAYTRDRVNRLIFGGATAAVLAHATVPLLMVD